MSDVTEPAQSTSDCLRHLLGLLSRGLLQYLEIAQPYCDETTRKQLGYLATDQGKSCGELTDLLFELHDEPDAGPFPKEYAAWHFVSLDFLADRLITDQLAVVAAADEVLAVCDLADRRLLRQIRDREAARLGELRHLLHPDS